MRRSNGTGTITKSGHISIFHKGKFQYEHIIKAEKALGKKLPKKSQVHHVDCDPANNANTNLVICADQTYHWLLHRRTRALESCGNADYIKCRRCGKYDNPKNMIKDGPRSLSHSKCRSD